MRGRAPFPYPGCDRCGWQYPPEVLTAWALGEITSVDTNPTHLCTPLARSMHHHPAGKRLSF